MQAIDTTLQLDFVREQSEFERLRQEWDGLLAASRSDGPFLRHAWLSSWWTTRNSGNELSVLTCRDAESGRLLGALPLYVTQKRQLFKARIARFIGEPGVGAAGLSALLDPDNEEPVLESLRSGLTSAEAPWDVLDLRYMDPAHPFTSVAANMPRVNDGLGEELCPLIALPPDWDGYLKMLSKNWRHQVTRSLRRIERSGMWPEAISEPADLDGAADDFFRLHEGRMRQAVSPDYQLEEAERFFTRKMMGSLLDEGRLRLMFVTSDLGRAAVLYQLRHGDTMYAMQSGFDEELAGNEAQRALWAFALRSAIEEGCESLDMMHGDHEYKQHWAPTDTRHLKCLRVYGASPVGRMIEARDRMKRGQQ